MSLYISAAMNKESTISVFVKEMRVNLRIGIHDFERQAPQPVDVSVELFADISYLSEVDNDSIIDYAKLYEAIKTWEGRAHVELIEDYLKELLTLGFFFDRVVAVRASISKANIFEETDAAGLEVFIRREDWISA